MIDNKSERQLLNQMIGGYWISPAIYVAAELGVADILIEGPRTADQLAEQTNVNCNALYRLLRALASVGIFAEDAQHRFLLTPIAEHLRSDAGFFRSLAKIAGTELYQCWGNLLYSVQTGNEAFHQTFGALFFDYMMRSPDRHAIYDEAMAGVHGIETGPMIDSYDFSSLGTVVDIGGGNGLTLAGVLQRHPTIRGILFDLPAVADRAQHVISDLGLSDRCEIVGGDFFTSVPVGCDAYIMRHIMHDWDDTEAAAILSNCREAMGSESRVLVVESVIPPGNVPCNGKWLDLMMLIVGGRERTEDQYRLLFAQAGLKLNRVIPTTHEVSIIEGIRMV